MCRTRLGVPNRLPWSTRERCVGRLLIFRIPWLCSFPRLEVKAHIHIPRQNMIDIFSCNSITRECVGWKINFCYSEAICEDAINLKTMNEHIFQILINHQNALDGASCGPWPEFPAASFSGLELPGIAVPSLSSRCGREASLPHTQLIKAKYGEQSEEPC